MVSEVGYGIPPHPYCRLLPCSHLTHPTSGQSGECFEQYRVASGLSKEDDERQVSVLLYHLGEEADNVLTSTNITSESRKKVADVLQKFDDFFQVRKNIIFERVRFNQCAQGETETTEQFIISLYSFTRDCEFGKLKGTDDPRPNRCEHLRFFTLYQVTDGPRFDSWESQTSSSSARSHMGTAGNLE